MWNISYDSNSGQALIFSVLHPDCALDVREDGGTLYIDQYEEDKVSQLWRYKNNFFFNQGMVIDVPGSSEDAGEVLGLYSRHGGDNQQFHVVQKEDE